MARIVKEMCSAAKGQFSRIKLQRIPVEYRDYYTIHEYDGLESVLLNHDVHQLEAIKSLVKDRTLSKADKLARIATVVTAWSVRRSQSFTMILQYVHRLFYSKEIKRNRESTRRVATVPARKEHTEALFTLSVLSNTKNLSNNWQQCATWVQYALHLLHVALPCRYGWPSITRMMLPAKPSRKVYIKRQA